MTTDGTPTQGPARSSESFRVLAEAAPVGMVETDLEGRVMWTNPRWQEITGLTAPTTSLADIDRLTHPDDRQRLAASYREALLQQRDLDTEARIVRPDGGIRHVRVLGAPVIGRDGRLHSYVGVVQDVTDLHQAVDARQRSERRYRDLIEKAPVGQAVYLTDGVMVEVNKAWADLLGYRPDEVIGRRAIEFVHPDDRDATLALARNLLRGEIEVSAVDRRLVHHDGSTVWVASSIRVERDQDGGPLHFHSLIVDITDSVMATQALRESEARYRRLIDEAPVGQVISRTDGTLVEVNRAFVDLLGSTREELFTRDPRALFHPDDLPAMATSLARLLDGEIETFQSERRLVRPDGSIVWVAGGTTLIEQRGTRYLHSVMHDITERKLAEDALTQSEERYRTVIEALHDGVLVQSLQHLEAVNDAAVRMLGHGPAALGEVATYDAMDPIDEQGQPIPLPERATIRAMRDARPMLNEVAGLLIPDRGRRWFNFNAVPRRRDGRVVGAVTTFSDITEAKLATDALRESENRFRTLAESLPVGVFQYGPDIDLVYVNPRWLEIVEITEQEALGTTGVDFIHPDDVDRVVDRFLRHLDAVHPYQSQYRLLTPSGTTKWVSAYGTTLRDPETGAITAFIGSLEDVTPLVDAQEETSRLAGIVESTSDLVSLTDHDTGELLYLNKAARDLLGFSDRALIGVAHLDLFTPDAVAMWEGAVRPTLERGESWSGELSMRAADGSTVHVWQTVAVKRRSDGTVYQLSTVGRDVTERRRFEAELAHQATHDALTDLPNRALLLDHLDLALARTERDGRLVALLFIDLDRFKRVNDSLGHQAGDELLVAVAQRIGDVLRPTDTVARLGGDEFVVLCEDVADEHRAVAVAQRVLAVLEGAPFAIGADALSVTASVGIALSAGGPDAHGEALLRDADAAMYRAKDQGRARLELFDESMRRRAAKRLELAEQLAAAIEHGAITVHFQPCVDLTDGAVTGVEALARWEHPSRGLLGPYEFIGLAEDTGLIVGLGLRVLTVACAEGRRWQLEMGERAPRVHVNLSARQLATPNLPLLVEGVLTSTGMDPRLLCLEITESVLMDDAAAAVEVLSRLKRLGLAIAIDDFGTGYSSLSYLRRFPVDVLKVDRSFVDGLGPDPEDSAVVEAIIGLANTLDLEAVAEGVETAEQLAALRQLGCTAAQGFHFARPAPARAVDRHLHEGFAV